MNESSQQLLEALRTHNVLTEEELAGAMFRAKQTGQSLQQVISQQEMMSEMALTSVVADLHGVPVVELTNYLIKPEVLQLIPQELARSALVIPIFKIGHSLTVAVSDPDNVEALDLVHQQTGCEIKVMLAGERSLREAIEGYYGPSELLDEILVCADADGASPGVDEMPAYGIIHEDSAPIVHTINLVITQAVQARASDIHFEPGDGTSRMRFRIDGVLQEMDGPEWSMHSALVNRIKVMAKLNIAESRKPQDGRIRLQLDDRQIDLRVSTIPTLFGEKVTIRLLDSRAMQISLTELGLSDQMLEMVTRLLQLPHGMLLVTGPTGSGKTSTLYAGLSLINSVERNIITVEDPIEIHLAGINQVQTNLPADVTFANALRAFLRQDPDVIMVGEIRDRETAEIAMNAALTGHLVLSTLHTNDAASSLSRLIDMGIEPFLVATGVTGILAQRLVRVICDDCRAPYTPPEHMFHELQLDRETQFYHGQGCEACMQTGYRGRIGIFELLPVSEEVQELVTAKAAAHTVRGVLRRAGLPELREDGIAKAAAGLTTLEEVFRVTSVADIRLDAVTAKTSDA